MSLSSTLIEDVQEFYDAGLLTEWETEFYEKVYDLVNTSNKSLSERQIGRLRMIYNKYADESRRITKGGYANRMEVPDNE